MFIVSVLLPALLPQLAAWGPIPLLAPAPLHGKGEPFTPPILSPCHIYPCHRGGN